MRRPPALARQGLFLQRVSVRKFQSMQDAHISYEITAAPFNCGYNVPLLAAEFLQVSKQTCQRVAIINWLYLPDKALLRLVRLQPLHAQHLPWKRSPITVKIWLNMRMDMQVSLWPDFQGPALRYQEPLTWRSMAIACKVEKFITLQCGMQQIRIFASWLLCSKQSQISLKWQKIAITRNYIIISVLTHVILNVAHCTLWMSTLCPGLAVDVTAEDLRYAMQGIPAAGQLKVTHSGNCRGYNWQVEWRSNTGSQPLIQVGQWLLLHRKTLIFFCVLITHLIVH